jgi:hypothetical protein
MAVHVASGLVVAGPCLAGLGVGYQPETVGSRLFIYRFYESIARLAVATPGMACRV